MPLELGIFLGAKRFGRAEQKGKVCLILDTERYRYQQFMSDIAGQDISAVPTEAEVQAIDDHVKLLSERLASVISDLKTGHQLFKA